MAEARPPALILLAAGRSRRMGQPKQLLPVAGQPLLRHVVDAALSPAVSPFLVVLGSDAVSIRRCLDGVPVQVVINAAWEEGLGASLRAGMKALTALAPDAPGVVVALADQPNFSARVIHLLLAEQARSGRSIVATDCQGVLMPPAYFGAAHFPALAALAGEAGARALFFRRPESVARVRLEEMVDLDTPEDYAKFRPAARSGRREPS